MGVGEHAAKAFEFGANEGDLAGRGEEAAGESEGGFIGVGATAGGDFPPGDGMAKGLETLGDGGEVVTGGADAANEQIGRGKMLAGDKGAEHGAHRAEGFVDATDLVIARGQERCRAQNLSDCIRFVKADACNTGLATAAVDFVWGEDAWCYVVDKPQLIREAARIVKSAGTIAFTDWVQGPIPMTDAEAARFLRFMKFANIQDIPGYSDLLKRAACKVLVAEDTGRFAPCIDLYLQMLSMQLTYDALQIIGFNSQLMAALSAEMLFVQDLARSRKIIQALFVARKE
ncbi:MAG TPA: methyltransferase domain-containing protein [Tepidisphaeraceae bacterium]|nr:methyltransferase domain-containing protein [Tepidisphaeraceae bacterium]